jgi:peptidyl-prolyl cis-trans isomerase SDCCAG10
MQQYNLSPPTKGKVILYTTNGEIEIELFAKETPRACRNFVQLCLEGYYDNCIFHRIIPNFIVQTGLYNDNNGHTIYNKKFEDEIHSRLKFHHRGIVACAGENNQNDSQFFITLEKANELNFKHTIFGKIAGDTIFNVAKMGELEVDSNNRPLYPPKIIKTEVLWNPFTDIEIRKDVPWKIQSVVDQSKKKKKKAVKNVNLLSFGDEVDQSNETGGMESSHDILTDKKLSKKPAVQLNQQQQKPSQISNATLDEFEQQTRSSILSRKHKHSSTTKKSQQAPTESEETIEKDTMLETQTQSEEKVSLEPQIKKRGTLRMKQSTTAQSESNPSNSEAKSYLEEQRKKYAKRKRTIDAGREDEALKKIAKFTSTLNSSSDQKEKEEDDSWKSKKLVFDKSHAKEIQKADEEYAVHDPLHKK